MKSKLYLLIVFALIAQISFAQDTKPKSADDILANAKKTAAKEGKNVFIMWHASWCGWCHLMDTLMNDESIKNYFDDSYVIKHLVVKEFKEEMKKNENPGGAEMLAKYNGDKAGIPFWVILDKKGSLLADSFMREEGVGMDQAGKNTGCPQQKEEVDHWIKVLKTTSEIPDDGLDKIKEKFLKK